VPLLNRAKLEAATAKDSTCIYGLRADQDQDCV
jgi:hypothetical protein